MLTKLNLTRLERKTSKSGSEYFTGTVVADHEFILRPSDRVTAFNVRLEASDGNTFNLTSERYEYHRDRPRPATCPAQGGGRQNAAGPEGAYNTEEAKARYAAEGRWEPQDGRSEVWWSYTKRPSSRPAQIQGPSGAYVQNPARCCEFDTGRIRWT